MSERIKEEAKKVNISELFYDLVFVYGVSRITHIFHGLNEGIISGHEILLYVVVFICFFKCMEYSDGIYEPLWKT